MGRRASRRGGEEMMLEPVWAARPTAGSRRFTSSSMRLVAGVACVLGSLTLLTLSGDLQLPLSLQALTMEPGRTDADGAQHLGAGIPLNGTISMVLPFPAGDLMWLNTLANGTFAPDFLLPENRTFIDEQKFPTKTAKENDKKWATDAQTKLQTAMEKQQKVYNDDLKKSLEDSKKAAEDWYNKDIAAAMKMYKVTGPGR